MSLISVILIINVTDCNINGVSKFEFSTSGDKYTQGKKKGPILVRMIEAQ